MDCHAETENGPPNLIIRKNILSAMYCIPYHSITYMITMLPNYAHETSKNNMIIASNYGITLVQCLKIPQYYFVGVLTLKTTYIFVIERSQLDEWKGSRQVRKRRSCGLTSADVRRPALQTDISLQAVLSFGRTEQSSNKY